MYECDRNKHLHYSINASAQIWNHSVSLQRRFYRIFGKYIGRSRLQKHIAKLRNRNPYWKLVGSQAAQDVINRLDRAYCKFFKWAKTRKGTKTSPPKFKSFRKYKSFTLTQAGWSLLGASKVRIHGRNYKFCKSREVTGQIKTVTIKRDNMNRLWVCFLVAEDDPASESTTGKTAGFDFGMKDGKFLTPNKGESVFSPLFFRQNMRTIASRNKELVRKKKGSNNRKKAKHRLALAHKKIANRRRDWQFKTAHSLLDKFDTIYLEDLNIKAMQAMWGRKISDLAFSDFVLVLEHLAKKRGKRVVKIGRWEPTSKTCNNCGEVKGSLLLSDRVFNCDACHVSSDRDVNAAKNIHRLGRQSDGLEVVSRKSNCAVLS